MILLELKSYKTAGEVYKKASPHMIYGWIVSLVGVSLSVHFEL